MRTALFTALLCSACWLSPAQAGSLQAGGVEAAPSALSWGNLQGRVAFSTSSTSLRTSDVPADTATQLSSVALVGDYYFRPNLQQPSYRGLRATTGLVLGQRSNHWGMGQAAPFHHHGLARRPATFAAGFDGSAQFEHSSTLPYLGIGYTGGGSTRASSWGFSADLGLMSLAPGNISRLGRVANGSQNLDDMLRDLRVSPIVHFGFSYSF